MDLSSVRFPALVITRGGVLVVVEDGGEAGAVVDALVAVTSDVSTEDSARETIVAEEGAVLGPPHPQAMSAAAIAMNAVRTRAHDGDGFGASHVLGTKRC